MPRFTALPCMTLLALLAAGCSSLSNVPPGTPLQTAINEYGTPTQRCSNTQPQLVNWSMQPMGYYAWTAEVDQQEVIVSIQQMLSDEGFKRLDQQPWEAPMIACWYGPPAVDEIALWKGKPYRTWSYRYKQGGAFNSLMYMYFNDEGQLVHHHPGPDPRDINDGIFRGMD